jgi:hypothetical protein
MPKAPPKSSLFDKASRAEFYLRCRESALDNESLQRTPRSRYVRRCNELCIIPRALIVASEHTSKVRSHADKDRGMAGDNAALRAPRPPPGPASSRWDPCTAVRSMHRAAPMRAHGRAGAAGRLGFTNRSAAPVEVDDGSDARSHILQLANSALSVREVVALSDALQFAVDVRGLDLQVL